MAEVSLERERFGSALEARSRRVDSQLEGREPWV